DSPGNDLESIAGQVASGCNMIFFATGNGSITNFPFVPTVKVVTTTQRFQLLESDMDVNAGTYQEGTPMDELGKQTFDYMVHIASGQRSVGEKAGHAQVQIWRNWRQTDGSRLEELRNAAVPTGKPIPIRPQTGVRSFTVTRRQGQRAGDRVGLILPTSLCSGQVAQMIVRRLNKQGLGQPGVSRFVALAHTEGCGNSGGDAERLYVRAMVGYATHPMVKYCLMLEHGCEKTHNDFMRHQMEELGVDGSRLGYASIQLDGGIDKVTEKVEAWFADQVTADEPAAIETVGPEALRIGLISDGPVSAEAAEQLAAITKLIAGAGGTVVVPANSGLATTPAYMDQVAEPSPSEREPSIAYGEHARHNGFHLMESPTEHWVETVTGLAATGVELIIGLTNRRPMQSHPFVPIVQVASEPSMRQAYASDMDLLLTGGSADWADQILALCKQILERKYTPKLVQQGNIDFQFTRGNLGVSL
ncbi:MAG: D-galactarate dehydratase/Altronate hydrolase-like protein, partial [Paenibacillus sp.]|nr:D-galactarate dehydratase/Altronate hydrolase-like protein [Paenibacillus sp.]